jgi:hypothetical protein
MIRFWLGLLLTFFIACGNNSNNNNNEIEVDTTEEYTALGYPDARKIVRDSENNLYVAYRKKYKMDDEELHHIFVAKSTDQGQNWQITNDQTPIERVGDYTQRVPTMAIDGNDALHVIWYGNDAQNDGENERQIRYSRSIDGGETWSDWLNIADVAGYEDQDELWQEHPTLYVDGENNLYATWQGKDAKYNKSQVKFSMSGDGGNTWTAWINVNPSNEVNYSRPTIITTRDGRILYILAYSGSSAVQQIVWTKSTDGGRSWTAWQPVAADNQDQRHVSVAIDTQDRLHAVWRQQPGAAGDETPSQIHYAVYNGQSWSRPEWVGPNPSAYQVFPSITFTGDNQVWVVWSENETALDYPKENPGSGSIYYAVKSGDHWDERTRLREGGKDIYPSLGRDNADPTAQVDLVWLENTDSGDNKIYYKALN